MKRIGDSLYSVVALWTIAVMLSVWLVPVLTTGEASAAQITLRKLTMSSGSPVAANATTTYTLNFTLPTTGTAIESLDAQACTTSLGTCTMPTGFSASSSTLASQPVNLGAAAGWTVDATSAGDLRVKDASNATNPTGAQTVVWNNVQNPTTGNTAFYLRITTYTGSNFSTGPTDSGNVAGAVVTALQVTASVSEILQFCVGATTVDDLTTAIGATCSGAPGASSTVGLGSLDPTVIRISPVAASPNGGSNTNGLAILRTNAQNGTSVYYDPIAAGSGTNHLGALRITGAVCSAGATNTDGCINSQGGTQGTFTAGTENFGFTIAGVSCVTEQTYSGAYACSYTGATEHLVPQAQYIGQVNTYGTTSGYAFNESTGSSYLIAQAASSNSVSDEALLMKFASTPAISTPFGSYSVSIDYTAVPEF